VCYLTLSASSPSTIVNWIVRGVLELLVFEADFCVPRVKLLRLFVVSFPALGWTVLFCFHPYYLTMAWSLDFQPAKLVSGFLS
jgi:hypothetical protein